MTNEEKAREIANNCSTKIVGAEVGDETYITTEPDCYTAAMTMAKWKDEQYKEREEGLREIIDALEARLQKSNEAGMYYFDQCNILKQQLIDKVCEWLEHNVWQYRKIEFLRFIQEFQTSNKRRDDTLNGVEVNPLNAFKNAMKGEQHPEAEHKAKDVENDICRECTHGNFTTNICNKGYTRCDGQNCFDYEKDEEL